MQIQNSSIRGLTFIPKEQQKVNAISFKRVLILSLYRFVYRLGKHTVRNMIQLQVGLTICIMFLLPYCFSKVDTPPWTSQCCIRICNIDFCLSNSQLCKRGNLFHLPISPNNYRRIHCIKSLNHETPSNLSISTLINILLFKRVAQVILYKNTTPAGNSSFI